MAKRAESELDELLGRAKVLAVGSRADDVVLAGTKDRVATKRADGWVLMGWHQVERGAWRGASNTFRWSDVHGNDYEVQLDDPGRMPELFHERVQASTVMTTHHDLARGELRIVVRRSLDPLGDLHFYVVPSGGASLDDPLTREFVLAETDRLKAEYGLDSPAPEAL